MYGVVLIVSLIVTGGVIAFIGDRLGTKIGKKRLSIFGLRPRYTSIIITILTGAFITTLTFGALAATSENVRTALFGMEQLKQEMATRAEELSNTTKLLADVEREQEETNEKLAKSKVEMEKLRQEQAELEAESEKLKAGNAELAEANENLKAQAEELQAQNETIAKENNSLTEKNTELSKNNADLEKRAEVLQTGLITMREGDIMIRANEVLASGVIRGGRTKAEVEADFAVLANLASRNISAQYGVNITDSDIWIYPPEYEAAVQEIVNRKEDSVVRILAAGNLLRGEAVRSSLEVYPNSVIYQKDEFILARAYTIDDSRANMSEEMVMDFFRQINAEAVRKGILADPIKGSVGVMDSEEFYAILNGVRPLKGNIVLSAYAKYATDALGPLRLNVHWEKMNR
ncbi:MAG: DUF3084 domain-containing protein [Selenomonadaceae bacterium]|nr:DUF3084 domain-containing protein [Selenomonadaceae bacterium]MBR3723456.1 DUF3084 domain-containing protein [Selenomonadaceae bacterium]